MKDALHGFAWAIILGCVVAALAVCCARPAFAGDAASILSAAPVAWHTRELETPEERAVRLGTIARAVDEVAKTDAPRAWGRVVSVAAVLAVMQRESAFDPIIHAGGVHPVWTQDRGRARCMGQIHESAAGARWAMLAGTDYAATERCAREVLRQLARAAWCARPRAGDDGSAPWARVFSAYGSGAGCAETPAGRAKAALFGQYLERLRR